MNAAASTRNRRSAGRPTAEDSVELVATVRRAALDLFLDRGFDATTMDAVAAAAGVTRRTLYLRYHDKSAMFYDAVHAALMPAAADDPLRLDLDDLEGSLFIIGREAFDRAVDERVVRLGQLVMRERTRFPNLVPKEHHILRLPHMNELVDLLRHHAVRGRVSVDDLETAAEQFLTLVASHPARLASFGLHRGAERRDYFVQRAVDLFLHGVGRKGTS